MTCLQKNGRAEKQLFAEAQKRKSQLAKAHAARLEKDTYSMLQGL